MLVQVGGTIHQTSTEMNQAAYAIWFAWYGLRPAAIDAMAEAGVLTDPPPYHPCGKFSCLLTYITNVVAGCQVNWPPRYFIMRARCGAMS